MKNGIETGNGAVCLKAVEGAVADNEVPDKITAVILVVPFSLCQYFASFDVKDSPTCEMSDEGNTGQVLVVDPRDGAVYCVGVAGFGFPGSQPLECAGFDGNEAEGVR